MDIFIYVIGENLDGSNQLALKFQVPLAYVNVTAIEGIISGLPHMELLIKGIIPGDVISTYSSFGEVNDLLISRALAMLMQNNADLYAISVATVKSYI